MSSYSQGTVRTLRLGGNKPLAHAERRRAAVLTLRRSIKTVVALRNLRRTLRCSLGCGCVLAPITASAAAAVMAPRLEGSISASAFCPGRAFAAQLPVIRSYSHLVFPRQLSASSYQPCVFCSWPLLQASLSSTSSIGNCGQSRPHIPTFVGIMHFVKAAFVLYYCHSLICYPNRMPCQRRGDTCMYHPYQSI